MPNYCRRCHITELENKKRICKKCQNDKLQIYKVNKKFDNYIIENIKLSNKLQITNDKLLKENQKLKELLVLLLQDRI